MISNVGPLAHLTRRELIVAGLTSTVSCSLLSLSAWSAPTAPPVLPEEWTSAAELYAFASPSGNSSVLALTWAPSRHALNSACVHVDEREWTINFSSTGALEDLNSCGLQPSCIFSGLVRSASSDSLRAIVLEIPSERLGERSQIWAEQRFRNGSRRRIGSPLVSAVLARHPLLARAYHGLSPARDAAIKSLLADVISSQAAQLGKINDPQFHGIRLAELLLPDVVHYSPRAPSGFTFASQNGRHPEEADARVVHSVLFGAAHQSVPQWRPAPLKTVFPYFQILPSVPV